MHLFTEELANAYEASVTGAKAAQPALSVQYADYVRWQRTWVEQEAGQTQLAHWARIRDPLPADVSLPTDRPLSDALGSRGDAYELTLSPSLVRCIRTLGGTEKMTAFMTLLVAFDLLLARWCGQDEVTLGVPVAGRNRPEFHTLIGLFINYLVLRLDGSGHASFRQRMREIRKVALDAYSHQDVPYPLLIKTLRPPVVVGRNPLYRVLRRGCGDRSGSTLMLQHFGQTD